MSATLTPEGGPEAASSIIEATEWFYSRQGVRNGPIPLEQFRKMIESGEVVPEDRVYAEGMGQWAFLREVVHRLPPKSAAPAPAPAAPAAPGKSKPAKGAAHKAPPAATKPAPAKPAPAPAKPEPARVDPAKRPPPKRATLEQAHDDDNDRPTLNDDSPVSELNGRTAEILSGFPTPMGDTTTAPLDFEQLDELRVAAGHRKALTRFKMLCTFLTLATFCLVVIPLLLVLTNHLKALPEKFPTVAAKNVIYTSIAVSLGLIVVYQAASAAAHKAKTWGPLLVSGVIVLGAGLTVWRAVMHSQQIFRGLPEMILFGVICLTWALFIGICVRAIAGAAGFVTSPAWCQEALIYSKL
jgi:hypothetical protein